MKFVMPDESHVANMGQPRFIVFGVGGGGGNAVEHMVRQNVKGITFVCANTDLQALNKLSAPNKIQLGADQTRGLGAGADPELGRIAAESSEDDIRAMLEGCDMVFITAGMGGGTGTGAAPVVARIAKEMEILTVAVVTTPFSFEGKRRIEAAKAGLEILTEHVDSIIIIPNEKLRHVYRNMTMMDSFKKADEVLLHAVNGLTETIINPGHVNIDFNDVKTAMTAKGHAMMGIGRATGSNRAIEAIEKATRSPLLDDLNLCNAQGLLINILGANVTMEEVEQIVERAREIMDENAHVFFGLVDDAELGDELHVTVVATGLTVNNQPVAQPNQAVVNQATVANHTSAYAQSVQQATTATTNTNSPKPLSIGSYLKQRQETQNN